MNSQRGMSLSVQVALLFPLAMLTLLGALQWSLVLWAEAEAAAAAQDAARAAALWGGSERAGHEVGEQATANGAFTAVVIAVERGERWTTATVTGSAVQVLPFVDVKISQVVTVPTQRLG